MRAKRNKTEATIEDVRAMLTEVALKPESASHARGKGYLVEEVRGPLLVLRKQGYGYLALREMLLSKGWVVSVRTINRAVGKAVKEEKAAMLEVSLAQNSAI